MEILVDGVFDPAAARAVAGQISSLAPSTVVILDFTNVVQFHDSAIAPLAQALAEHRLVTLRGVGRHQLRLLRYLGARFLDCS